MGKRSSLPKSHLRSHRTLLLVVPAQPDSVQSGSELLSDLEGTAVADSLAFTGSLAAAWTETSAGPQAHNYRLWLWFYSFRHLLKMTKLFT